MPREIKSRVWCKNKNDWESHAWCVLPDGGLMDLSRKMRLNMSNHIHELSTGLTDKNGVEIYEGDIISQSGYRNICGKVIFWNGAFWVSGKNRKGVAGRDLMHLCNMKRLDVVGNIHENPELMEGES